MAGILNSSDIKLDCEPYILETSIEGFFIIKRPKMSDDRGSFQEYYRIPDIENSLRDRTKIKILQSQVSVSSPNVLRGIHAEDQAKLITPMTGKIIAVVVDLRLNSPTFKKFEMIEIDNTGSSFPFTTLYLDQGLGNSFYVYSDSEKLIYSYAVTAVYDPKNNGRGVRFNDETLAIPWPTQEPNVSDRDRQMPTLDEFVEKYYGGNDKNKS